MSSQGEGSASGEELRFRARVTEILDVELKRKLKGVWIVVGAFVGGFALFIGAGLTWTENLLRPIVESIYPTSYISEGVRDQLLKDTMFKVLLLTEENKTDITAEISRSLGEHVDSGYTKTIIFSQEAAADSNFLIFYARKEQEVELTILATATGSQAKFRLILDGSTWDEPQEFPYYQVAANITEHLRFDREPGGNLHRMRFQPVDLNESDRAVIELVVLVRNPGS